MAYTDKDTKNGDIGEHQRVAAGGRLGHHVDAHTGGPRSAQTAPPNDLAPSYQQATHLWAAHLGQQLSRKMPRLMVPAWDIPGVCDISAMTTAINSHLRRHETYRNWFQIENNVIVRRTIANPDDIEFVPRGDRAFDRRPSPQPGSDGDAGNAGVGLLHLRGRCRAPTTSRSTPASTTCTSTAGRLA